MSLAPGVRLGAYEVIALLGAGGMGEVYRARDTRLGREVAIKVIPTAVTADTDRLQRFEQEARAAATLNHPNILAVHDVGAHNGAPFIVSELLEGETLRQRLSGAPLPARKAIELGIQIAQGLAAAHEKGIVHRDLKPENIFINKDGRAKILDFGLAKLTQPDRALAATSNVPTTPVQTQHGMVLGTLGYMAPEQVRGLTADHRADIFSFGAILYEMLSGRRAFAGDTTADTMSAILKEDPPDLPIAEKHIPPALSRIIDRCLEKNPAARFASAADLAFALEALSSHSGSTTVPSAGVQTWRKPAPSWVPWTLAALAWIAAVAVIAAVLMRPAPAAQTFRSTLLPPEGVRITDQAPSRLFALSPDGRRLAFVGFGADRRRMLWVRSLDALSAQPLAGTEDAVAPFWSPDSRSIGFFAGMGTNHKLKKIDVEGGPPTTLCNVVGAAAGADWNTSGDILFSTTSISGGGSIQRVSQNSGAPSVVIAPDAKAGETDYWWPFFLPDGKHFLFLALGAGRTAQGIYAASLDSGDRKLIVKGGSNPKYAQGHILFMRETTLMAQKFDVDRLQAQEAAVPIAENLQTLAPNGAFSVSQTGVLAYATGELGIGSRLTWIDGSGRQLATVGESATYADLDLSPDGKRAALTLPDAAHGTRDVWIMDLMRDLLTKITFDPADDLSPVWSPDGERIIFSSRRKGRLDLYEKASSGAGSETLLLADNVNKNPQSWSSDGRFLLYAVNPGGADVWALPLFGDKKPFPFLTTPFNEISADFSPDGRWVSYSSNESGRPEVYVTSFPGREDKWQVSSGGAVQSVWRRDGRELIFAGVDGRMMAAPVTPEAQRFTVGARRQLFQVRPGGPRSFFGITSEMRFLVNTAPDSADTLPITLVVNWHEELRKK